jgi:hypothetical protein
MFISLSPTQLPDSAPFAHASFLVKSGRQLRIYSILYKIRSGVIISLLSDLLIYIYRNLPYPRQLEHPDSRRINLKKWSRNGRGWEGALLFGRQSSTRQPPIFLDGYEDNLCVFAGTSMIMIKLHVDSLPASSWQST